MQTLDWDAGSAGADPANQRESSGHTWSVTGATHDLGGSGLPGITGYYDFDGVGDRIFGSSLAVQVATNDLMSIELWVRPAILVGGQQMLFDTGGRVDGLSFTLDDGNLLFRVLDSENVTSAAVDLSTLGLDLGEFSARRARALRLG